MTREYVRGRTPEETKARKAEKDRARNARTKERRRELQRARHARLRGDPEYAARRRANDRKQYLRDPDYYVAKGAESARRKARTFGGLSPEHRAQVVTLYRTARRLTEVTGIPHEVDHIEPLRGKTSCGLHVPWNMRVITAEENREKGNRSPC